MDKSTVTLLPISSEFQRSQKPHLSSHNPSNPKWSNTLPDCERMICLRKQGQQWESVRNCFLYTTKRRRTEQLLFPAQGPFVREHAHLCFPTFPIWLCFIKLNFFDPCQQASAWAATFRHPLALCIIVLSYGKAAGVYHTLQPQPKTRGAYVSVIP